MATARKTTCKTTKHKATGKRKSAAKRSGFGSFIIKTRKAKTGRKTNKK